MNRRRPILIALVFLLVGTPVWGYIVLLQDGTQIITREKYRRDGDKVYLVLQNGTETFIDASEVDFAKTDELNKVNLGQSRVLDQSSTLVEVEKEPSTRQETLRQLAGRTSLTLPELDRRDSDVGEEIPLTPAGFVDLWRFDRLDHPNAELVAELKRSLENLGTQGYEIYRGTAPNRALLEMAAVNSERSVLEGIRDAAAALIQSQTRFPDDLEALELVMSASTGSGDKQRAGQFVLTRPLANELISGAVEPTVFFVRHVQF